MMSGLEMRSFSFMIIKYQEFTPACTKALEESNFLNSLPHTPRPFYLDLFNQPTVKNKLKS